LTTDARHVWKNDWLVKRFLDGVRGGIPHADDQLDVMLRLIAATEVPVQRFLDLGCGSGLLTIAMLAEHPQAQATLVDYSEPMMDAARDLLEADVSVPRFILADLAGPDWQTDIASDAPFDAVVSGFAIHHLTHERKRELFREIFRLLRPGAMFVNIEHVASPTRWAEALFETAMIDSLSSFQSNAGLGKSRDQIAREFQAREDKAANILAPVDEQCHWLVDAGFDDVDCYFKYFELSVIAGRRPE
jgi:tRNA (cmo5U34)-methyltransferase